jgi:hypothetical protein
MNKKTIHDCKINIMPVSTGNEKEFHIVKSYMIYPGVDPESKNNRKKFLARRLNIEDIKMQGSFSQDFLEEVESLRESTQSQKRIEQTERCYHEHGLICSLIMNGIFEQLKINSDGFLLDKSKRYACNIFIELKRKKLCIRTAESAWQNFGCMGHYWWAYYYFKNHMNNSGQDIDKFIMENFADFVSLAQEFGADFLTNYYRPTLKESFMRKDLCLWSVSKSFPFNKNYRIFYPKEPEAQFLEYSS